MAVLNIELDPEEVDVNVHPTKAEIKFKEPRLIFKAVQRAVRNAVVEAAPVPNMGQHHTPASFLDGHAGSSVWQSPFETRGGPEFNQMGLEIQRTLPVSGEQPPGEDWWESQVDGITSKMPPMRVVGQIQQMYIIAEGPDGLYLIDQHAAHERILYEKLAAQRAQATIPQQQLLEPVVVELSPGHAAIVDAETGGTD